MHTSLANESLLFSQVTEAKIKVWENWKIQVAMTAKVTFQEKNLSVE